MARPFATAKKVKDHAPRPFTERENYLPNADIMRLTAEIVSAHLSYNKDIPTNEIPRVILQIYRTIQAIQSGKEDLRGIITGKAADDEIILVPAVDPNRSVYPDKIICLECGKALKALTTHLRVTHSMSVHKYKLRWELPDNYPTVPVEYRKAIAPILTKNVIKAQEVRRRNIEMRKKMDDPDNESVEEFMARVGAVLEEPKENEDGEEAT